jgi:hypothetical protein
MTDSEKLSPFDTSDQEEYATIDKLDTTQGKYKEVLVEDVQDKVSVYEEDIDIQVVNELATVEDDTSLPCFTLRVFVTGVVSIESNISYYP